MPDEQTSSAEAGPPMAAPLHPLLLFVFDAVTAERVASLLRSLLQDQPAATVVVLGDIDKLESAFSGRGTCHRVVVARADATAWSCGERYAGNHVLAYMVPDLLLLDDLLTTLCQPDRALSRRVAAFAGHARAARAVPTLSMESLYFRPGEIVAALADCLAIEPHRPAHLLPPAAPEEYRQAVTDLLARMAAAKSAMFDLGITYPVAHGTLGATTLGSGWSRPEAQYTWNNGPRAVLRLLVPPCSDGPVRLRCRGRPVHSGVRIATYAHDTLVTTVDVAPDHLGDVLIDIPLSFGPVVAEQFVTIAFVFDKTVIPAELGINSDRRQLALALASIEFYADLRPARYDATRFIAQAGEMRCMRGDDLRHHAAAAGVLDADSAEVLRELLDGWDGALCVVFADETDAAALGAWATGLAALHVGAVVIASPARMAILFTRGDGSAVVWFDGTVAEALAAFAADGTRPDLLLLWSTRGMTELVAIWDQLLATSGTAVPDVVIRTADFRAFDAINDDRKVWGAMISYRADLIAVAQRDRRTGRA